MNVPVNIQRALKRIESKTNAGSRVYREGGAHNKYRHSARRYDFSSL